MLNWILLRCIGGELDTGYWPIFARVVEIYAFKIRTKGNTPMIRCTIPADKKSFSCVLESQVLNKDERPCGISGIERHNTQFASKRINCAVIRLTLPLIADW